MNFELSDTQRELKDMVARLMRDRYGFAARQRISIDQGGFSKELWNTYAELGLLGVALDDDHGGVGGGFGDVAVVMEEFGRALVLEPFIASSVLAGGLIAAAAAGGAEPILAGIADGSVIAAVAHAEKGARYTRSYVETTARQDGGTHLLNGAKTLVLGGDVANQFAVSARTAGSAAAPEGVSLFLIERETPGLSVRAYRTQDDMTAAEVTLSGVRGRLIGPEGGALPLISHAYDRATAALCAEAVGAMQSAFDITLDYIKTRRQFGAPIGSFQALQHKAVDMLVALEHARSMAIIAARYADEQDADERARAISAAKIGVDRSSRTLGQLAIQLHGGIGMTEEYAVGHYVRRLTAIGLSFGDLSWHVARLAALTAEAA